MFNGQFHSKLNIALYFEMQVQQNIFLENIDFQLFSYGGHFEFCLLQKMLKSYNLALI